MRLAIILCLLIPVHAAWSFQAIPVDPLHEIGKDWLEERKGRTEAIRLVVPRNGTASAPVVVQGTPTELRALRHRISPVVSQNLRIADTAFQVRYGTNKAADLSPERDDYDILVEENPVQEENFVPLWITVTVPPDQPPGIYRGMLDLEAAGQRAQAPLEVEVAPYIMPNPSDMITYVALYQSPEGVAWHYDVPMWSDAHLDRMAPSFRLLGRVGQRHLKLYVHLDTYFGTTGTIPLRETDGRLRPDFQFAEKYLRRFQQEVGPVDVVSLIVWGPNIAKETRLGNPPTTLAVAMVGADGNFVPGEVPMYGPPETEELWREVVGGTQELLNKLGWTDTLLTIGVGSDARPSDEVARFFGKVAPGVNWYLLTHGRGDPNPKGNIMQIGELKVAYYMSPFGPFRLRNEKRPALLGGWNNEFLQISTARFGVLGLTRPLINYRSAAEGVTEGPWRGLSGMGLDFWNVRHPNGRTGTTFTRDMPGWPRMHTNNTTHIAAPGPEGAITTTRFEMLVEGIQECEARITIERVLVDKALRQRLPPGRADVLEQFLEDRAEERYAEFRKEEHGNEALWAPKEGALERARKLFNHAAEAQAILMQGGAKAPASTQPGAAPTAAAPGQEAPRTWTLDTGESEEAIFVSRQGDIVLIRRADGKEFRVPFARLSPADQTYVQSRQP